MTLNTYGAAVVRTSVINVIFTSMRGTLKAIRVAAALARTSGATVRLIDPRPTAFPLRSAGYALAAAPEVPLEEREREHVVATAGLPVDVLVCKGRRAADAVQVALPHHSLVVMGGRRSWWPTEQERLQRTIEELGHVVMLVDEHAD